MAPGGSSTVSGRVAIQGNPSVQAPAPHSPVHARRRGRNEKAACIRSRKKYMNAAQRSGIASGSAAGSNGFGRSSTAASARESTSMKAYGVIGGAILRAYIPSWVRPVTRKNAAVPSTQARARPRRGLASARQAMMITTATERVAAASISPRRSSRAKAASSRAPALRSPDPAVRGSAPRGSAETGAAEWRSVTGRLQESGGAVRRQARIERAVQDLGRGHASPQRPERDAAWRDHGGEGGGG